MHVALQHGQLHHLFAMLHWEACLVLAQGIPAKTMRPLASGGDDDGGHRMSRQW
jgi:hypothetical protein